MRRARIRCRRIYTWIFEHRGGASAPLSVDLTSSRSLWKVTPGSLSTRTLVAVQVQVYWVGYLNRATIHRSCVAKNRYRTHRAASRWSMDRCPGLGKRKAHVFKLKRPWSWRTTKDQHSVHTGIDSTWHRTHLTYDPICMRNVTNMST